MSRRTRILTALGLGLGLLAALAAGAAWAQSLNLDLGGPGGSSTGRIIQVLAVLTVLSLAPSIIIMVTSFTRIVIVLSFLRFALGTQQSPPNVVLVSLALFLTGFIMTPTFTEAYNNGIAPLIDEQITEVQAFEATVKPFHSFMMTHVREQDLSLFQQMAKAGPDQVGVNTPLQSLVPAFMISELRRAFEIGFLIYLPFLIIDMVIASVLMAMGMMMLPPALISLPFKLIFFVLIDGWYLIAGSLVRSFGTV
ncbi:MAG: flagellar type III secretion system pore protein FliP [Proteobacteria bacterium]|nr:flagellar type III secretion system pore protein FliP [Pseudomonadota bacterium]MBI3497219.1 flagellar type III secretion system pore protein FliP [Pseudomonadota bacterium]